METADIEAIPIIKTFDLKDEKDAYDAAEEICRPNFFTVVLYPSRLGIVLGKYFIIFFAD